MICPKLRRIPGARPELSSLLSLAAVAQEDEVLLSADVLYRVYGGGGGGTACVFMVREREGRSPAWAEPA